MLEREDYVLVERERREMGFETWREAEQVAKDRRRWRDLIKGRADSQVRS